MYLRHRISYLLVFQSCTEKEECQKGPGSMNYPDRVTNALCVDPDTTQIIPSQTCCHSDDIAKFTPDNCDSATHVYAGYYAELTPIKA